MAIDIEIRKASNKDKKQVITLAKETGMFTPRFKSNECVIAIRGENLIGIARLKTHNKHKLHELSSVVVKDGWRNCGIGTMLVSKLIKQAKYDICLNTINPDFYSKMGFRVMSKKPKILLKNGVWCKGCDKKACASMVWPKN